MIQYNMTFAVGLPDGSWFEAECTYWGEDEGDVRAIEAGEAQLRNSYGNPPGFEVSFITLLHIEVIEDEEDWPWETSDDPEFYGTHNMNEHNDAWAEAQPGYDGNDNRKVDNGDEL